TVHEFADAAGEFRVHGFALGLTYLLQDDLFSSLRGNASEGVRRLGKTHDGTDFSGRIDAMRIGKRNFLTRILDVVDNLPDAVNFQGAGGVVEIRNKVFGGPKMLASGH